MGKTGRIEIIRTSMIQFNLFSILIKKFPFNYFTVFFNFIVKVKDIYLHPDPFSVQNGLLTPTYKLRRPQVKNYFKPQLEDMYNHLV